MELTDYVRILRRNWRLVLATMLTIIAITSTVTALTPREYRAQAELFISTAGGDTVSDLAQGGSFTQRQVATYADLVTTPLVLDQVVAKIGLDESTSSLAKRVTATVPPNTVLIDVQVLDRNPVRAAQISNAVAEQFAATLQELERVEGSGQSPVKATVVQPATAPESPASPHLLRNLALAIVLGVLLGVGIALVRDLVDRRVRGEADARRVTDEPILGAIAVDQGAGDHPLLTEIDAHSPRAEAFRALRTNLIYLDPDGQPQTFVITSSVPNEGKSTTTANLALATAETGSTVCLVEGDLRRPRLVEYLGLENAAGLTDIIVGRAEIDDVLQPYTAGLRVLGCGSLPPNPSELLGSASMDELLKELAARFDYVIIDAPPLMAVTDGAILSTMVDGTIVVVGAGIVKRDQLERSLHTLEQVDANVLGLVLNRLPIKGPDAYEAYTDYRPDLAAEGRGTRARSRRVRRQARAAAAKG